MRGDPRGAEPIRQVRALSKQRAPFPASARLSLHIGRAWNAKKNRATGIVIFTFNAVLIATAFGLYYLATETLRPWASDVHIACGLAMPLLLLVHVKTEGKRG